MNLFENIETFSYGFLYFFCSASMLLFNKLAIHSYNAPGLLLSYQYIFCVTSVFILKFLNLAEVDPLSWKIIQKYWPVPALFACAVFSNNKILQYANIETFIVVRNTTPLFVSAIEFVVMGKNLPSFKSFSCFVLIIVGAVMYGLTDRGFRLESYIWASIYLGVFCTEMVFVKHIFNSVKMTTWGRMLYTNLLSIPFQPFFIFTTQEYLGYNDLVLTPRALTYVALSCIGAFGISFAGIGFRAKVSATTFTVVGVVNKIITILINYFMWDNHASNQGLFALALCLFGSTFYEPATLREPGSNSSSERLWNCCNLACGGCCDKMQLARDDPKKVVPKVSSEREHLLKSDSQGSGAKQRRSDIEHGGTIHIKTTMKQNPQQEKDM